MEGFKKLGDITHLQHWRPFIQLVRYTDEGQKCWEEWRHAVMDHVVNFDTPNLPERLILQEGVRRAWYELNEWLDILETAFRKQIGDANE